MSGSLSKLSPPSGGRTREKRVGRGVGTGLGKTCGRGQKGQKARQPGNINKLHFQGGQVPMQRRLPKRGFRLPFPIHTTAVNVGHLDRFDGGTVGERELRAARLVQKAGTRIKILGDGELTKKLDVTAHGFSKAARAAIEKLGGTCTVLPFVTTKGPKSASERSSS